MNDSLEFDSRGLQVKWRRNWFENNKKGPAILTEDDSLPQCSISMAKALCRWIIWILFMRNDDGAIKRLDALLFSSEIPKKLAIVLDADN